MSRLVRSIAVFLLLFIFFFLAVSIGGNYYDKKLYDTRVDEKMKTWRANKSLESSRFDATVSSSLRKFELFAKTIASMARDGMLNRQNVDSFYGQLLKEEKDILYIEAINGQNGAILSSGSEMAGTFSQEDAFKFPEKSGYYNPRWSQDLQSLVLTYWFLAAPWRIRVDLTVDDLKNIDQFNIYSENILVVTADGVILTGKNVTANGTTLKEVHPDFQPDFTRYVDMAGVSPMYFQAASPDGATLLFIDKLYQTPVYIIYAKKQANVAGEVTRKPFGYNLEGLGIGLLAILVTFVIQLQNRHRRDIDEQANVGKVTQELIREGLTKIESGDFSYRITLEGLPSLEQEKYRDYREIVDRLNSFFGSLEDSNHKITQSLKEIEDEHGRTESLLLTLKDSFKHTEEVMNSVSSTSEELTASMENLSQSSETTNSKISDIYLKIEETDRMFGELYKKSNYIIDVSHIIDELNEELQLIGINTAIEASRLGQEGMGFMVIAETIRQMGDETNKRTKEIFKYSKEISRAFSQLNSYMKDVSLNSEAIKDETDRENRGIREMAEGIEHITREISELNDYISVIAREFR